MHFAPAQRLIQLIALLPVVLRPGVFLALVIALVWFVFVYRGLPSLWRRTCRGAAIAVDLIVGVVLLPEYLLTTARRTRGGQPGSIALAVSPLAEQVLNAASVVYQRNLPKQQAEEPPGETSGDGAKAKSKQALKTPPKKRFPWVWCGLVIAVCAGGWIAMDQMSQADEAKRTFADAFEYWREVEAWAEVGPSRRAALGDPVPPVVVSISYHRWLARMSVHCPGENACAGTVNIRARSGAVLVSKSVEVPAEGNEVTTVELPHSSMQALQHLRVEVAQP
jgi:hypothetical protein